MRSSFCLLLLAALLFQGRCDESAKYQDMAKAIKWPESCTRHPYAISAKVNSQKLDEDGNGGECTLVFPYFSTPDARINLCMDMYYERLISSSGNADSTTCVYRTMKHCEEGFILVRDGCYRLHEKTAPSYEKAAEMCKNDYKDSELAGARDLEDLRYIFYLANPLAFGLNAREVWISSKEQMIFRRGVDLPGNPGDIIKAPAPTSARFYCVKQSNNLRSAYKRYCDVVANTLKLKAVFESGNCFILSPSNYAYRGKGGLGINTKEAGYKHFNDHCQYFSLGDYAVSPVSNTRRKGMVNLIEKYNLNMDIILPAYRDGTKFYIMNMNIQKAAIYSQEFDDGAFLWDKDHKVKYPESDAEDRGQSNTLVMGTKSGGYKLKEYPTFFRGHRICTTGVKQSEALNLGGCNLPTHADKNMHSGWKGVLRDDGQTMCIKAFVHKLDPSNPSAHYQCGTYDEANKFCQSMPNTVLTPVQSHEEQTTIAHQLKAAVKEAQEFENKHNVASGQRIDPNRSIFIGATKLEPLAAREREAIFKWDYDQTIFKDGQGYTNWWRGEPNMGHGYMNEYCIEITMSDSVDYRWVDVRCDNRCMRNDHHDIGGIVCARFVGYN